MHTQVRKVKKRFFLIPSDPTEDVRDGFPRKIAILLDFVQITSPPSPQFGQLVQLFSDVEIQDLKVS